MLKRCDCDALTDIFLGRLCDEQAATPPASVEELQEDARQLAEALADQLGLCPSCADTAMELLP